MISISSDHFATAVDYIHNLRQADFTEKQAEAVVKIIEYQSQAIQAQQNSIEKQKGEIDHLKSTELATKGDIKGLILEIKNLDLKIEEVANYTKQLDLKIEQTRAEIYKSKYEVIIWVAGMFLASGILQHFLK